MSDSVTQVKGYSGKGFAFFLVLVFICFVVFLKKEPIKKYIDDTLVEYGFKQEVEELPTSVLIPEIPEDIDPWPEAETHIFTQGNDTKGDVDEHEIKHFYLRASDAVEIRISYVISSLDYYEEWDVKTLMRAYFSEVISMSVFYNQHRHMEIMKNLILNEYPGINMEIVDIGFPDYFMGKIKLQQEVLIQVEIAKARAEEAKHQKILTELKAQQELINLEHKRKVDVYNAETAAMIDKIRGESK